MVQITKTLTENKFLCISGGGPGAMEATHLGALLAGKDQSLIDQSLQILAQAPKFDDKYWLDKAMEVIKLLGPPKLRSLGIPTWLYGHEKPTPFATHIAKYFANSIREDTLLTIAKGGIIFAKGSAGTIQEIFQEVTQNHYLSFDYASPMIFLNKEYWTNNRPVYPFLKQMTEEEKLLNLTLSIHDDENEIINKFLVEFRNK